MITAKDIVDEVNKQLRSIWTDREWKHGKDVIINKAWAGRLKFIAERYSTAGWIVKKHVEISSTKEKIFFLNFKNPLSCNDRPTEISGTGVSGVSIT